MKDSGVTIDDLLYLDFFDYGQVPGEGLVGISGPRFGYSGAMVDQRFGFYHLRHRVYDPRTGRFLSRDPLEYAAGSVNLYEYVGSSPVTWLDPLGLMADYNGLPKGPNPPGTPTDEQCKRLGELCKGRLPDDIDPSRIVDNRPNFTPRDKLKHDNPEFDNQVDTTFTAGKQGVHLIVFCGCLVNATPGGAAWGELGGGGAGGARGATPGGLGPKSNPKSSPKVEPPPTKPTKGETPPPAGQPGRVPKKGSEPAVTPVGPSIRPAKYPSVDPANPPIPGKRVGDPPAKIGDWEWKGSGQCTEGKGNWLNPRTKEKLYPDRGKLGDPKRAESPHWDYTDPDGKRWRWWPDGTLTPK